MTRKFRGKQRIKEQKSRKADDIQLCQAWPCPPVSAALGRLKQEGHREHEASRGDREFKASLTQGDPVPPPVIIIMIIIIIEIKKAEVLMPASKAQGPKFISSSKQNRERENWSYWQDLVVQVYNPSFLGG